MKTTFAATALIAFVSAAGEYYDDHDHSDYDNGYTGPIAPESFGYAVNDFDINEPTIDDECYAHQVDIYSDQIVAIEATRVILQKLIKRVEWAEEEIEDNARAIADNREEIRENDWETRANAADIEELEADISDLEDCIGRQ
jgi:peptidoglycan hydrolase CwlO-like protein